MNDKNKLYTIKQVSDLLGVSRNTIYNYIKKGMFNPIKMGDTKQSATRISAQEVEKFINRNTK